MTDSGGVARCSGAETTPKLYGELASWWPLLSAPADYEEEASIYRRALTEARGEPPRTLLEIGSGGGNNALHLKAHFDMTLVDRAEGMLEVSRALNPECEHLQGDMRKLRLGRTFDAVFIHDAIDYIVSLGDLRRTMETAFVHLKPGGACLLAPDHLRETFRPSTGHGGHDGEERSLRYLEWTWDPDPTDSTCVTDYAYLLRSDDGDVRVEHDRHVHGLFARADWLRLLSEVGFEPKVVPFEHSEIEPGAVEFFIGTR